MRNVEVAGDLTGPPQLVPVIAELLHHGEDFFARNEPTPMHELIAIDGLSQFTGGGGQVFILIGELTTFHAGSGATRAATIKKQFVVGANDSLHVAFPL
jgi:hypothetical protein